MNVCRCQTQPMEFLIVTGEFQKQIEKKKNNSKMLNHRKMKWFFHEIEI